MYRYSSNFSAFFFQRVLIILANEVGLCVDEARGRLYGFKNNQVANLSVGSRSRSRFDFQRPSRAENERRNSPWTQFGINSNHPPAAIKKDDVDRNAHKEHVHQHERLEPSAFEQHSMPRFEPFAAQQSPALPGDSARRLEKLAQNRSARTIYGSKDAFSHL